MSKVRIGLLLGFIFFVGLPVTSGFARPDLPGLIKADRVVVVKGERKMYLFSKGAVVREYAVALGRQPVGHKLKQGDGRTPEGRYVIDTRNPGSNFHRSIRISYPGPDDRRRADILGVSPGGQIMIHGQPNTWQRAGLGTVPGDWTQGCIAVTNAEMDEIWKAVDVGTPIEIRP